jgi:hypothetical protein
MANYHPDKYLSVSTANPGWFAVYNRGGKVDKTPLVAWAIKEMEPEEDYVDDLKDDGYESCDNVTDVVGLTLDSGLDEKSKYANCSATLYEVSDRTIFLGYDYPGCDVDWEKTLKEQEEDKKTKNPGQVDQGSL